MDNRKIVKEHFIGVYSPGRSLAQFAVELENVPGALAKASTKVAGLGIKILSGFHASKPREKTFHWSFFADFTDVLVEPDELAGELKKLDVVYTVEFTDRVEDVIFDELHFPFTVLGERSITLRVSTLAAIFKDFYEALGSGGAFLIYRMGEKAGKAKVTSVRDRCGFEGLKALRAILKERAAKGWCLSEVVAFDKEGHECVVKVQELFECTAFKDKDKRSKSQFFRGYLKGLLDKIFHVDVKVAETMCVAKGDPHCLFEIKPTHQSKQI